MKLSSLLVALIVPWIALKITTDDFGIACVQGPPQLVREFHHNYQEIQWPNYRNDGPQELRDDVDKPRTRQWFWHINNGGGNQEKAFEHAVYKTLQGE